MNSNPFQSPNSDSLPHPRTGRSRKAYVYASAIAASLFLPFSALFWYALGATYTDGQVVVDDSTVGFSNDANGNPYATYDTIYFVDTAGFIVLHLVLMVVLLLVVNMFVWVLRMVRPSPNVANGQ